MEEDSATRFGVGSSCGAESTGRAVAAALEFSSSGASRASGILSGSSPDVGARTDSAVEAGAVSGSSSAEGTDAVSRVPALAGMSVVSRAGWDSSIIVGAETDSAGGTDAVSVALAAFAAMGSESGTELTSEARTELGNGSVNADSSSGFTSGGADDFASSICASDTGRAKRPKPERMLFKA